MKLVDAFWTPIAWVILKLMDFFDWINTKSERFQIVFFFISVTLLIILAGLVEGSCPPEYFVYY